MLRPPLPDKRKITAAAGGALALALIAVAVRLAFGPVDAGWVRPIAEHVLASQVPGGHARVAKAGLAWFGAENSLGFELDGVSLQDARGRTVLNARHLDAGIAFDGLLSLTPAVGRVSANDFFAAVSVSPKGHYALGYDAQGKGKGAPADFGRLFADLTGHERFARPDSFLRNVELTNGRLAFRQVGGAVAWNAQVHTLKYEKLGGRLFTRADVEIDDARTAQKALLNARGSALVGLRGASGSATLQGLVPALVFPSVGGAAPLSTLNAEVDGHGSIAYDLKAGVRAADLTLSAGKGAWRSGADVQAFNSAQAVAQFDPRTGAIEMRALKLDAQYTQLDLTGRFKLVPDDARNDRPAHVDFLIAGPKAFATLADDEPSQQLSNVSVIGRFTPERKRLELQRVYAQLGTTPLAAVVVFNGDDQDRWGCKLTARVGGTVTPQQVLAFWPRRVAGPVRDWLKGAVLSAQLANATFNIDADPGAFSKPKLANDDMRIGFDFHDASLRFAPGLTPITSGVGRAVVQGNRFDLALTSGRLDNVVLSEGVVEIPAFKPDGGAGIFKGRAVGDAHEILQFLDRPPLRLFTPNGFDPSRASGVADLKFEVDRPMLFEVPAKDYKVKYTAVIHRAALKEAALGWDLSGGELKVDGDQDKVQVGGHAFVGPYHGKIDFQTRYQGEHLDHVMSVDVDGMLNASILGGRHDLATPLAGKFRVQGGDGSGVIHAPVFDGRVDWKGGDGPDRMVLSGWASAPVLRKIGAPFVAGAPDRMQVDARFARAGAVWRGPVRADALAANITYMPTPQRSRVVVQADLNPIEAKRMGLGGFPLFNQARRVIVDANWSGAEGVAQIRAGTLNVGVGWNDAAAGGAERRLRADFSAADLASLGLPQVGRPGAVLPVSATWKDTADGGLNGSAVVDAIPVKFVTAPGKNGAEVFNIHADLDQASLRRIGAPDFVNIEGITGLNARWATVQKASAGRLELDFARAALSVDHTDWKKPMGQAGRLSVDFLSAGDGPVRLNRISGEGATMDVEGTGVASGSGRITSLDLPRTRLTGLIDAAVKMTRDAQGENLTVRGKWLDVRRLVADLSNSKDDSGAAKGAEDTLRFEADVDGLRFSDGAALKTTSIRGVWGPPAVRRLDVTAALASGAKVWGRIYPSAGGQAVLAQTADAGEAAKALFNVQTLRGGSAVLTGKLVEGGADLTLEMKNVRIVKAPTVSAVLTEASLKDVNASLNNEGVLFTNVTAPVQLRGQRLMIGESRATGPSLGITAKGIADLSSGTLDVSGAIAPAYALNAAIGHVPVLGQILTSRKGEGVVGLSYVARGSFEKPKVSVNPLSLVTPGILRRIFEAPVRAPPPAPPPKPRAAVSEAPAGEGGN